MYKDCKQTIRLNKIQRTRKESSDTGTFEWRAKCLCRYVAWLPNGCGNFLGEAHYDYVSGSRLTTRTPFLDFTPEDTKTPLDLSHTIKSLLYYDTFHRFNTLTA